ncbi:hypothetical protein LXA43DRAFT_1098578 [Ganoderma leucocontextum]|nr:hypothetical protein LXA43DRAFT_1098578 [Ganoderma leucocontextum]
MSKQLPTELWYRVIQSLSPRDQKTCLSVCKMHHDITIKYVFSHLIITLGLWRMDDDMESMWDINLARTAVQVIESKRVARVNYALLRHIGMRNPDFARNVKKLTVRAYSLFEETPMEYEIGTLVDAIEALQNLTAFAWYGPLPITPSEVMDALRRTSGQKVVDILLHPEIPENMCLPSFTQLESLVFTHRFVDLWPAMHADEIPYHKTVQETIAANAATLRRLDVFGDVLWECPSPSFANLHELTIVFPNTFDGLEVVKTHPDAFPNLTSFKLLSVFDLPDEAVEEVAKFLKKKKLLRRVDVITRTEAQAREALVNVSLLKILPELPRLEVLGLDIRPAKLTAAHVKLLHQYVPRQVTALFILFQFGSSDAKVADWRNFFSKHDALRYLHIATLTPPTRSLGNAIFKRPPPALELLGYNNGMRWVTHNPTTYSGFWPHAKMYFRTVEDYDGCEDWEWLLRHHGQGDDCDIWSMSPPDTWKRMDAEAV